MGWFNQQSGRVKQESVNNRMGIQVERGTYNNSQDAGMETCNTVGIGSLSDDGGSTRRHFIITKRKNPLRFRDMNLTSLEYEFVKAEKQATIFDSMTDTMSVLDKLCKAGEVGVWYREIYLTGEVEEHSFVFELNSQVKRYIGYNPMNKTIFWTPYVQKAHKCKTMNEMLQFGLSNIPKETLNELRIIDLKEVELDRSLRYLYYDSLNVERTEGLLDEWSKLGDDKAFQQFSELIEYNLPSSEASDIFKREVLKLMGARRYFIDSDDMNTKKFTKDALINLFSKLVEIQADKDKLFYIEWFIRNKLMTAEEVSWIVSTKWFGKTVVYLKSKYNI